MEFKDRLKALRKERKLSQQALADAIFVSRSAVAKWESGLGLPGAESMEALRAYFQLDEHGLETPEPEQVIIRKNRRILNLNLQRILLAGLILIALLLILPQTNWGMKLSIRLFSTPLEQHALSQLEDPDPTTLPGFQVHVYPDVAAVFYENSAWGYRGFFYSADGQPVGFQGTDMEFYYAGNGHYYWKEPSGDNRMHAEHITGNWYWYEIFF